MKRGTIEHPKTQMLADLLGIPLLHAVGIIESLFHWTAKYVRTGAIGSCTNAVIAKRIHWDGDPDKLIEALVAAKGTGEKGWLETHKKHRLVVHDWHDHADDSVRKTMKNNRELFWNGSPPFPERVGNFSGIIPEKDGNDSGKGAKAKAKAPGPVQSNPQLRISSPDHPAPEPKAGVARVGEVDWAGQEFPRDALVALHIWPIVIDDVVSWEIPTTVAHIRKIWEWVCSDRGVRDPRAVFVHRLYLPENNGPGLENLPRDAANTDWERRRAKIVGRLRALGEAGAKRA